MMNAFQLSSLGYEQYDADVAQGGIAGLANLGLGTAFGLLDFLGGGGAEFGQLSFEFLHAGDRLGGGVVGLLAACSMPRE